MTGPSPDDPALGEPGDSDEQLRRQLARAVRYWISVKEIWLHYFSLGGSAGEYELDAYINSSYAISSLQHDILAQAINELIDARPEPPRAPYSDDVLDRSDGPGKATNEHSHPPKPIDEDPSRDEY